MREPDDSNDGHNFFWSGLAEGILLIFLIAASFAAFAGLLWIVPRAVAFFESLF